MVADLEQSVVGAVDRWLKETEILTRIDGPQVVVDAFLEFSVALKGMGEDGRAFGMAACKINRELRLSRRAADNASGARDA